MRRMRMKSRESWEKWVRITEVATFVMVFFSGVFCCYTSDLRRQDKEKDVLEMLANFWILNSIEPKTLLILRWKLLRNPCIGSTANVYLGNSEPENLEDIHLCKFSSHKAIGAMPDLRILTFAVPSPLHPPDCLTPQLPVPPVPNIGC